MSVDAGGDSDSAVAPDETVPVLDELTPHECWSLLATAQLARIGFVVDGRPEVVPVNYAIDGESLLVRTTPGTLLDGVDRSVVALEIDDIDTAAHTGWSVQVHGFLEAIGSTVDSTSERLRRLDLPTWAPGSEQRTAWMHIRTETITGRRLRRVPDAL